VSAVAVIDRVLHQTCERVGLPVDSARLLHRHASTVYLIPVKVPAEVAVW
jgi:hypothetical protein